ncbi:MAG TPA: acyltransferase [Hyphomonadaceae bacterium]|nr:acyltransferase [Hyphomonadaceae bacterium]
MRNLVSLQYLRALAALGVLVFHAADRRGVHLFDLGQMGVDLFFVISGFVMWLTSERVERTPGQFFAERIARIAPTYWLATLLVLGLWTAGVRQGLTHPELMHTLKSFLFIPAQYPGKEAIYPLLIPGWTLNYEMFFYALFALSLGLEKRLRLTVMTAVLCGLAAYGGLSKPEGAIAVTYTNPILLEFLAGMWIAAAWTRWTKPSAMVALGVMALGVALVPTLSNMWPGAPRLLMWGLPAGLIVLGAVLFERGAKVASLPWLLLLGDASYSIYLWHFPSNPIWDRIAHALHAPEPVAISAMIAGGVGLGLAMYTLVELPARRASRTWLNVLWASKKVATGSPASGG